jgi:hypothetical protein
VLSKKNLPHLPHMINQDEIEQAKQLVSGLRVEE